MNILNKNKEEDKNRKTRQLKGILLIGVSPLRCKIFETELPLDSTQTPKMPLRTRPRTPVKWALLQEGKVSFMSIKGREEFVAGDYQLVDDWKRPKASVFIVKGKRQAINSWVNGLEGRAVATHHPIWNSPDIARRLDQKTYNCRGRAVARSCPRLNGRFHSVLLVLLINGGADGRKTPYVI